MVIPFARMSSPGPGQRRSREPASGHDAIQAVLDHAVALACDSTGRPDEVLRYLVEQCDEGALGQDALAEVLAALGQMDARFLRGWRDRDARSASLVAEIQRDCRPEHADALPERVRRPMEWALGADFADVHVREDPEASELGALAFARGNEIVFAPGQFQPYSLHGRELIGHELVHVLQQRSGRLGGGRDGVERNPALEAEADLFGARAARGELAGYVHGNHDAVANGIVAQLKEDAATDAKESCPEGAAGAGAQQDLESYGWYETQWRYKALNVVRINIDFERYTTAEAGQRLQQFEFHYAAGLNGAMVKGKDENSAAHLVVEEGYAKLKQATDDFLTALGKVANKPGSKPVPADELTLLRATLKQKLAHVLELIGRPRGKATPESEEKIHAENRKLEEETNLALPERQTYAATIAGDDDKEGTCTAKPPPTKAEDKKKAAEPVVTGSEIVVGDQVNFATNEATLLGPAKETLEKVALLIDQDPESRGVEIQGHTDDVGSEAYNMTLSQKRANAVKDYLVVNAKTKVAKARLTTKGFGKSQPMKEGTSADARAANRRVVFKLTPAGPKPTPPKLGPLLKADAGRAATALDPGHVAAAGVAGSGGPLPFLERLQAAFGAHDLSAVRAHRDDRAAGAARALGAKAYASGEAVAFAGAPDLHTAAHEAAHVVQQRAGVSLQGGMGKTGDRYEQHADAVADAVVAGRSASPLLADMGNGGGRGVQRTASDAEPAADASEDDKNAHLLRNDPLFKKTVGMTPEERTKFLDREAYRQMVGDEDFAKTEAMSDEQRAEFWKNEAYRQVVGEEIYAQTEKLSWAERTKFLQEYAAKQRSTNDKGAKKGAAKQPKRHKRPKAPKPEAKGCVPRESAKDRGPGPWADDDGWKGVPYRSPDEEGGACPPPLRDALPSVVPSDLVATLGGDAVQAKGALDEGEDTHAVAARGLASGGDAFPYFERIQDAFGDHDLSDVRAHIDAEAIAAARELRAEAYASGEHVAFAGTPDLHTAAHEAAHVIQQRGGVSLSGGVGRAGDAYEQHANLVADAVVRGESAATLLGPLRHGQGPNAVQRSEVPAKPEASEAKMTTSAAVAILDEARRQAETDPAGAKAAIRPLQAWLARLCEPEAVYARFGRGRDGEVARTVLAAAAHAVRRLHSVNNPKARPGAWPAAVDALERARPSLERLNDEAPSKTNDAFDKSHISNEVAAKLLLMEAAALVAVGAGVALAADVVVVAGPTLLSIYLSNPILWNEVGLFTVGTIVSLESLDPSVLIAMCTSSATGSLQCVQMAVELWAALRSSGSPTLVKGRLIGTNRKSVTISLDPGEPPKTTAKAGAKAPVGHPEVEPEAPKTSAKAPGHDDVEPESPKTPAKAPGHDEVEPESPKTAGSKKAPGEHGDDTEAEAAEPERAKGGRKKRKDDDRYKPRENAKEIPRNSIIKIGGVEIVIDDERIAHVLGAHTIEGFDAVERARTHRSNEDTTMLPKSVTNGPELVTLLRQAFRQSSIKVQPRGGALRIVSSRKVDFLRQYIKKSHTFIVSRGKVRLKVAIGPVGGDHKHYKVLSIFPIDTPGVPVAKITQWSEAVQTGAMKDIDVRRELEAYLMKSR